jgi:hypothetical protein
MSEEHSAGVVGDVRAATRTKRKARLVGGAILGIVALALVPLTIWWFEGARVCNEQLTRDGLSVPVCRHLDLSDPPVVAAAAVLLFLLFIFLPVQEVSVLGIGLKKQLEEAKEAAKSATNAAESAQRAAKSAKEAQEAAGKAQRLAEGAENSARRGAQDVIALRNVPASELAGKTELMDISAEVERLSTRYDENRTRPMREPEQSNIVAEMAILFGRPGLYPGPFEPFTALADDSMGKRVAGYVYFDQHTDNPKAAFEALIKAVQDEPKEHRNGQYLGLRAARRQVEAQPGIVSLQNRRALEALLSTVGSGTDRAYELRQILALAEAKSDAP